MTEGREGLPLGLISSDGFVGIYKYKQLVKLSR